MNRFLIAVIYFFIIENSGIAQIQITEIERSEGTKFIFNESDPTSLMSIIRNNEFGFRTMSRETGWQLEGDSLLKNAFYREGEKSYIPLSTVTGEDSLISLNGYQMFVYPPADKFFTDINDISKILVVSRMNQTTAKMEISELLFVKKYPGYNKLIITGSISYDQFTNGNQHLFFEELTKKQTAALYRKNGLWNIWRKDVKTYYPEYKMYDYHQIPGLTFKAPIHPLYKFDIFGIIDSNHVRPEHFIHRNYGWPILADYPTTLYSELSKKYKPSAIGGIQFPISNYALVNQYGEDSTVIVDGTPQLVFPEPEYLPYWIDQKATKVFAIYNLDYKKPTRTLSRLLFTTNEKNQNVVFADYNCYRLEDNIIYKNAVENAEIVIHEELETDWQYELQLLVKDLPTKQFETDEEMTILLETYFDIDLLYAE